MKPLSIFYILLCYVLLQFCWWAWLLVNLNDEVYAYKAENVRYQNVSETEYKQQQAIFRKKLHGKWWMIAGEGTVFLFLLGFGAYRTLRAFKQEVALNKQQHNFLLAITHELKSPLASIKLQLQTIQHRTLETEKQQSIINNALADTERLNVLIEKTLLATRIESANYEPYKKKTDVNVLLENILSGYLSKLKIIKKFSSKAIVNADEMGLISVFLNLIENAEKYAPEGSTLTISTAVEKGQVIISFADEGLGVPENERKKIFDKFYRAGNEQTRTTKGTGLGLFIVKHIIRQHGGSIVVKENRHAGAVFEISLPV